MIKILDCTIRDGGYYNKWQFSNKLIGNYIRKINQAKIDFAEVGFRLKKKTTRLGISAYSSNEYLKNIKSKYTKICIMVNAADLVVEKKFNKNNFSKLFSKKFPKNLYMVRIACHLHELDAIIPQLRFLKTKFRNIAINLMQISEIKNKDLIIRTKKLEKKRKYLKVFYIADSLGCLNKKKLTSIVGTIKKNWHGEIGFHAHDNMQKALSNCEAGIKAGITWLDSTLLGMGRGPGNVKTEELITVNKILKKKIDSKPIKELVKEYFVPLKKKFSWGTNIYYLLAAQNKIHPTYIQTLIGDKQKKKLIYEKIKILSKINSTNFNPDFLDNSHNIFNNNKNIYRPKNEINNRNVLIIGSGKSVSKHKNKIEKLIANEKLFTIKLNMMKNIDDDYVDLRLSSHPSRILSNINELKKITKKIIIPSSFYKKISSVDYANKNVIFFPFKISKKNKFSFKNNLIESPCNLSLSFALGIVNLGNAKKIYLAGFDGFENIEYKNVEFNEMINAYHNYNAKKFFSITKSKFNIKFLKKF